MVELVNNNSVVRSYYKHPFDVYSRLVNNAYGPKATIVKPNATIHGSAVSNSVVSVRSYSERSAATVVWL